MLGIHGDATAARLGVDGLDPGLQSSRIAVIQGVSDLGLIGQMSVWQPFAAFVAAFGVGSIGYRMTSWHSVEVGLVAAAEVPLVATSKIRRFARYVHPLHTEVQTPEEMAARARGGEGLTSIQRTLYVYQIRNPEQCVLRRNYVYIK